jgi:UDP-N-acetylmuramyl pentapeptide phosphotransferase/UDP-N-acetylglucosamine-1-phosphate transferase
MVALVIFILVSFLFFFVIGIIFILRLKKIKIYRKIDVKVPEIKPEKKKTEIK